MENEARHNWARTRDCFVFPHFTQNIAALRVLKCQSTMAVMWLATCCGAKKNIDNVDEIIKNFSQIANDRELDLETMKKHIS